MRPRLIAFTVAAFFGLLSGVAHGKPAAQPLQMTNDGHYRLAGAPAARQAARRARAAHLRHHHSRRARLAHRARPEATARLPRTLQGYNRGLMTGSVSYDDLVAPLLAKVREIVGDCGSVVVSAFRPGARVAGTHRVSNHALHRAADLKGNPRCIYSKLKGWPGGYSIDYASAPGGSHVHISYAPGGMEWGVRFVHHHARHRYAHRYRHRHHQRYARG